jgi:hypothetical protein
MSFQEYIDEYTSNYNIDKTDITTLSLINLDISDFGGIEQLSNLRLLQLGYIPPDRLTDLLPLLDDSVFVQANGLFAPLRNIIALLDQEDVQLYSWEEACRDGGDLSEARDFFRLVREQQDLAGFLPEEYMTADPDEIGDETLCMLNRTLKHAYIGQIKEERRLCMNEQTVIDMIDISEVLAYHDLFVITIDGIVYCFNTNDIRYILETRILPTSRVPVPEDVLRQMRVWYNRATLAREFDIDDDSNESTTMNTIVDNLLDLFDYPDITQITQVVTLNDVDDLHWILSNYVNYRAIQEKLQTDQSLEDMVDAAMNMYIHPDRDDEAYRRLVAETLIELTDPPGIILENLFNFIIILDGNYGEGESGEGESGEGESGEGESGEGESGEGESGEGESGEGESGEGESGEGESGEGESGD